MTPHSCTSGTLGKDTAFGTKQKMGTFCPKPAAFHSKLPEICLKRKKCKLRAGQKGPSPLPMFPSSWREHDEQPPSAPSFPHPKEVSIPVINVVHLGARHWASWEGLVVSVWDYPASTKPARLSNSGSSALRKPSGSHLSHTLQPASSATTVT